MEKQAFNVVFAENCGFYLDLLLFFAEFCGLFADFCWIFADFCGILWDCAECYGILRICLRNSTGFVEVGNRRGRRQTIRMMFAYLGQVFA